MKYTTTFFATFLISFFSLNCADSVATDSKASETPKLWPALHVEFRPGSRGSYQSNIVPDDMVSRIVAHVHDRYVLICMRLVCKKLSEDIFFTVHYTRLLTLDLSVAQHNDQCSFTNPWTVSVCGWLAHNRLYPQRKSFGFNNFIPAGFQLFCEILKNNTTLTRLDLGGNNVGSEGAKYIADVLKNNSTLTGLDLGYNKIGSEGVKYITDALKNNSTIEVLYLYRNSIDFESGKYFADVLTNNTTLRALDVGGNNMGSEGAKHIADALKNNSTLTRLYVGSNNIDSAIIDDMSKIRTSLKVLD